MSYTKTSSASLPPISTVLRGLTIKDRRAVVGPECQIAVTPTTPDHFSPFPLARPPSATVVDMASSPRMTMHLVPHPHSHSHPQHQHQYRTPPPYHTNPGMVNILPNGRSPVPIGASYGNPVLCDRPDTGTCAALQEANQRLFLDSQNRHKRRRANNAQLNELEIVFQRTFYPSTAERHELARKLGMTPRRVQIWFQNQRQKIARIESSNQLNKDDSDYNNNDDDNDDNGNYRQHQHQNNNNSSDESSSTTNTTIIVDDSMPSTPNSDTHNDRHESHEDNRAVTADREANFNPMSISSTLNKASSLPLEETTTTNTATTSSDDNQKQQQLIQMSSSQSNYHSSHNHLPMKREHLRRKGKKPVVVYRPAVHFPKVNTAEPVLPIASRGTARIHPYATPLLPPVHAHTQAVPHRSMFNTATTTTTTASSRGSPETRVMSSYQPRHLHASPLSTPSSLHSSPLLTPPPPPPHSVLNTPNNHYHHYHQYHNSITSNSGSTTTVSTLRESHSSITRHAWPQMTRVQSLEQPNSMMVVGASASSTPNDRFNTNNVMPTINRSRSNSSSSSSSFMEVNNHNVNACNSYERSPSSTIAAIRNTTSTTTTSTSTSTDTMNIPSPSASLKAITPPQSYCIVRGTSMAEHLPLQRYPHAHAKVVSYTTTTTTTNTSDPHQSYRSPILYEKRNHNVMMMPMPYQSHPVHSMLPKPMECYPPAAAAAVSHSVLPLTKWNSV